MEVVTNDINKCLVENKEGMESVNGQPSKEVISGDLLWVKLHKSKWWPAQVVDENTVSVVNKPSRKGSRGDVLVRLYGSYIYKYVDIHRSLVEFKNILVENNFNHIDILKKSLERDLPGSSSGRKKRRQKSKSKGVTEASQNGSPEKDISEQSQAKISSKRRKQEKAETAKPHSGSPETGKNDRPKGHEVHHDSHTC